MAWFGSAPLPLLWFDSCHCSWAGSLLWTLDGLSPNRLCSGCSFIWTTFAACPRSYLLSPLPVCSDAAFSVSLMLTPVPPFKTASCKPSHSAFRACLPLKNCSFLAEPSSLSNIFCSLLWLLSVSPVEGELL